MRHIERLDVVAHLVVVAVHIDRCGRDGVRRHPESGERRIVGPIEEVLRRVRIRVEGILGAGHRLLKNLPEAGALKTGEPGGVRPLDGGFTNHFDIEHCEDLVRVELRREIPRSVAAGFLSREGYEEQGPLRPAALGEVASERHHRGGARSVVVGTVRDGVAIHGRTDADVVIVGRK